jgi:adenylylsulfate kinase
VEFGQPSTSCDADTGVAVKEPAANRKAHAPVSLQDQATKTGEQSLDGITVDLVPDRSQPLAAAPILWFTGLSGAGKSTLAEAISAELAPHCRVHILDGDEVRAFLSKDLGFSKEDRDSNIRRIGYVARLLASHGVVAIVAAISPYAEARNEVRRLAAQARLSFFEIHVDASLETLIRRDVKGLYQQALRGEIKHFTGISDPYEPPAKPDLLVRTDEESVHEAVQRILQLLEQKTISSIKDASPDDFIDIGEQGEFVPKIQEGECAA